MKKIITIILSTGLILGFSFNVNNSDSVQAAAKKYKNCTQLNKVYKGGIAKSSLVKNKGGKTKYKPTVNSTLYNVYKSLDRDKDGIACER